MQDNEMRSFVRAIIAISESRPAGHGGTAREIATACATTVNKDSSQQRASLGKAVFTGRRRLFIGPGRLS